ncbi:A/G-specific adenine glycosylase [Nonlabens tegetincola]|uniref:A/G-specific adenine glycosylase n=1 Tax=Nonlabens tegetincola TaxID=323273 RepID=UPI0005AB76EF|nr:A/G-specific adenine glycosylase [Nonlabens tegetincola]
MNFSSQLIDWYLVNKRDLPWRHTTNPYYIWLSEVILQQTRVAQGLPYYNKFVETYPKVEMLAAAPLDDVLKLWQGLGYYSRARNLHKAAQQVVELGKFPSQYKDLLKLKGVGTYTAAAIASFSNKEAVPVVDGNVYRVLSRIFHINTPINTPAAVKEFTHLAAQLMDKEQPDIFNQAMMEFGALQCIPKNPNCASCVFKNDCVAYEKGLIDELPVKPRKTKVKNLFHNYLVIISPDQKTLLKQRDESGIWKGLYEFPLVETPGAAMVSKIKDSIEFKDLIGELRFRESVYNQQPIIHKLSHRKIHATFWIIELEDYMEGLSPIKDAFKKPVHVLMERFMNEYWRDYKH